MLYQIILLVAAAVMVFGLVLGGLIGYSILGVVVVLGILWLFIDHRRQASAEEPSETQEE